MWLIALLKNPKTWIALAVLATTAMLVQWHGEQVADFRVAIDNEYAAKDKESLEAAIQKAKLQWLADGDNIVTVEKIITKYKTEVKYEKIEVPSECTGYSNALTVLLDSHIDAANRAIESNR